MNITRRCSSLATTFALCAIIFHPAFAETIAPLPPGPYTVGCSSVEQDFARLKPGESAEQYWEGITADDGHARYVTDLLTNPTTPVISFAVPDDSELYGKLAGQNFSVALLICYPSAVDTGRRGYVLPNGVVVPLMQLGNQAPVFADPDVRWPLLEFSHGLASSPLDADNLGAMSVLASNGYIVFAPFHGDARVADVKLDDLPDVLHAIENFSDYTAMQAIRPLALKNSLDYILTHGPWNGHIDVTRVAGFGASLGAESLILQAGAKLTTSVGLSSKQVLVDSRLKSLATYVPYFGQPAFPAFGRDESGIDFMNPIPVLAIGGTADTTAPLSETQQGMERMTGTRELVALQGVQHGFDVPSTNDIFTWSVLFLNATTTRDPVQLARLQRATNVAGGGDDRVVLADITPYPPIGEEVDVIEYYNASLGHYFMTINPIEISILDQGTQIVGWTRTGYVFKAWPPSSSQGQPVCRYYGTPGVGPDTHFYSVNPVECGILANEPQWTLEGYVLRVNPVVSNSCPTGLMEVVRMYNNGIGGTANHRYTVSITVINEMVAKGWIVEGPVFCTPP
ncbi:MAG: hypothetical protein ABI552_17540 [Casimicrobiaceae bacterium]